MLRLAICDDNPADIDKTTKMVTEWADRMYPEEIVIKQFHSAFLLLDSLSHGEVYDLFLLDILMPEMTGITLAERIQNTLSEPLLIFLTSSEDFYSEAFRLYAFQYICKPVDKASLFTVLDKALARLGKQTGSTYTLKTAEGLVHIPLASIVYIELLSHVCHFHLTDGRTLKSRYLRTAFDHFAAPLLQHRQFVKTHASFVVNLNFAGKLTPGSLTLTTGVTVPVTRTFASQVQQSYMAYGLREGDDLYDI